MTTYEPPRDVPTTTIHDDDGDVFQMPTRRSDQIDYIVHLFRHKYSVAEIESDCARLTDEQVRHMCRQHACMSRRRIHYRYDKVLVTDN